MPLYTRTRKDPFPPHSIPPPTPKVKIAMVMRKNKSASPLRHAPTEESRDPPPSPSRKPNSKVENYIAHTRNNWQGIVFFPTVVIQLWLWGFRGPLQVHFNFGSGDSGEGLCK